MDAVPMSYTAEEIAAFRLQKREAEAKLHKMLIGEAESYIKDASGDAASYFRSKTNELRNYIAELTVKIETGKPEVKRPFSPKFV